MKNRQRHEFIIDEIGRLESSVEEFESYVGNLSSMTTPEDGEMLKAGERPPTPFSNFLENTPDKIRELSGKLRTATGALKKIMEDTSESPVKD